MSPNSSPCRSIVKSIAVFSEKDDGSKTFALLLLRGDHELNEIKARRSGINSFRFASEVKSSNISAANPAHGPGGRPEKVAVFADRSVAAMSDFVCGANEAGST
jgi:prolyl-tRNA synthetase